MCHYACLLICIRKIVWSPLFYFSWIPAYAGMTSGFPSTRLRRNSSSRPSPAKRARAGIQKVLIPFVYSGFRISFTSGELVRNDGFEVLCLKFPFQYLIDHLWIGFAACFFHYLPDKKSQQFGFTVPVGLDFR